MADALSRPRAVEGNGPYSPAGRNAVEASTAGKFASGVRRTFDWLGAVGSFWTVVPVVGLVGFIYLYGFTDLLYQSQTILDLQNAGSTSLSLGSLGSSLLGSAGGSTQSGAVVQYIQSADLLRILDKQFHLRRLYADNSHSLFWRLDSDASDEDFLSFFQQMVTVTQDSTTLLITVNVLDYDPHRAQQICQAIVKASQNFVKSMTSQMQIATLNYAKTQLATAIKAVETAQPYERPVAEMELTAAQQAQVAAQGLANQQQSFLLPVVVPNFPTDTTDPDRLVDEAAILLASAAIYLAAHLLIANARDHRRA